MNGPVSMYRCRQIIHHDQPIQLPDCVFKTKNILAVNTSAVGEKISNNLDISQQVLNFLKVLLFKIFIL